jgi:hypothetical protein
MGNGYHFWSDNASEPKKAYNWVMTFNGVPQWMLKTASKPNFSITESSHSFLGHTFYHPGRVEWQPIDVTLGDPVQPDAAASMLYLLRQMGYDYPDGLAYADGANSRTGMPTGISKKRAVAAMGLTKITQLDADGDAIEEWRLHNPWITKAEFGSLDYSSDVIVDVSFSIRFDYAVMTNVEASLRIAGGKGKPQKVRAKGSGGGVI